jgi:hypothetical protein
MNERQYHQAQHSLFESLALGSAKAAVVPLRKEYANAATCLTVVHLPREELATAISREIIKPLREAIRRHYWYPSCFKSLNFGRWIRLVLHCVASFISIH